MRKRRRKVIVARAGGLRRFCESPPPFTPEPSCSSHHASTQTAPPTSNPYSILPEKNKKELTTETGQQPRCQRFPLTMSKGAEKKGRRRERQRKRTNKETERGRGERWDGGG